MEELKLIRAVVSDAEKLKDSQTKAFLDDNKNKPGNVSMGASSRL